MDYGNYCYVAEKRERHFFDLPWRENANGTNVQGCGLLMDSNDKLAIFFTINGKLKGQFGYGESDMELVQI
jgi:hypothetical protein